MKIRWRSSYLVLFILAEILIFVQIFLAEGGTELQEISITEEAYFDPFCVSSQRLTEFAKFNTTVFCNEFDNGVIRVGSSENIQVGADTFTRYLFLKIPMSAIPESTFSHEVKINEATLNLKTRYNGNETNPKGDFVIFNGWCDNTNWSEDSKSDELPCLAKYHRPDTIMSSYSEPIFAKLITQIPIDINSHVKFARTFDLDSFTEVIEFLPMQHMLSQPFTKEQQLCMFDANDNYEALDCISNNSIFVYTSEHRTKGLQPTLVVQYEQLATPHAQAINTALLAFIPIIGSVIFYWDRQNVSQRNKMVRVCNTLHQEIADIHNGLTSDDFERKSKIVMTHKNGLPFFSISLPKPISMAVLSIDAYNEVINSGSFENFKPDHQTRISTLFNHVKVYNKEFSSLIKLIDEFYLLSGNPNELKKKEEEYGFLIEYYGAYLGNVREEILSLIDQVLKIIEEERESNS